MARFRAKPSPALQAMSEAQFQEELRKLAAIHGYRYFHNWSALHSPAGFPDCVLVNKAKRRLIFAELKSDTGKLTDQQQEWIDDLKAADAAHPERAKSTFGDAADLRGNLEDTEAMRIA